MENLRKCYKCKNKKPLEEFPKNGTTATGIQVRKYKCKVCDGERLKVFRLAHPKYKPETKIAKEPISVWFWKLKEELSCLDCKVPFKNQAYLCDFHHRDPSTKVSTVGGMYKYASRQVILEEIAKCDPLCSNCHRRRHYLEKIENMNPPLAPINETPLASNLSANTPTS